MEWAELKRDLEALQEVEVPDGESCCLLRTPLQGEAGKVREAVGVALPPTEQTPLHISHIVHIRTKDTQEHSRKINSHIVNNDVGPSRHRRRKIHNEPYRCCHHRGSPATSQCNVCYLPPNVGHLYKQNSR